MRMNITLEKVQSIRKIVEGVLGEHPHIVLFGSRARMDAGFGSDIDIGVSLDGRPLPSGTLTTLKEAFDGSSIVERVDVVDMGRVSAGFKMEVEKEAIII